MGFLKRIKNEEPIMQFFTTIDGLEVIEECQPKPAKNYIPSWWKATPAYVKDKPIPTVKMCPSFPDYFSQGFILPMWADTILSHSPTADTYEWKAGREGYHTFNWDFHPHYQLLDHTDASFMGVKGSLVFKAISPWFLRTPPGWSVLQLPLFYHFNSDYSVLPGILHTDVHHELNHQVLYHGNGNQVEIKRGTPFVHYIPFKRSKYKMSSRHGTLDDLRALQQQKMDIGSKFTGSGAYRARVKRYENNEVS